MQRLTDMGQVEYSNNIVDQDPYLLKKITKPMIGFKAFHFEHTIIYGIETEHMIRKGQLSEGNILAYN